VQREEAVVQQLWSSAEKSRQWLILASVYRNDGGRMVVAAQRQFTSDAAALEKGRARLAELRAECTRQIQEEQEANRRVAEEAARPKRPLK